MTGQKEEELSKRLFDQCKKFQQEWFDISDAINLIPDHEHRLRRIESKLKALDDLPKVVSDIVKDLMKDVEGDIRDIKINQDEIRKEQRFLISAKKWIFKVSMGFSFIGLVTFIFIIGNLTVDQLIKLITGVTPAP